MRTILLGSLMVTMLGMPATAGAQDTPGYKLGRGLTNATLGFLSYPAHADACSRRYPDTLFGVPCALKAVVPTVGQHLLGVVEVFTFPLPFPWPRYASPYGSPGDLPWERTGRYRPNRDNPPIP